MIPLPRHHLRRVIDPLSPSRVPWGCQGVVWARIGATSIDTYRAKLVFIEGTDLCIVIRRIIPLSSFLIICTNDHFASINRHVELLRWILYTLSSFLPSFLFFLYVQCIWNFAFQTFITRERNRFSVKEKYLYLSIKLLKF